MSEATAADDQALPDQALPDDALQRYRATLHRRGREAQQKQLEKHARAQALARQMARRLEDEFGAARVVLFGAVAAGERLSPRSDIDLAVWGLSPERHLEALARLQTPEFSVDLIRGERCSASLRAAIRREGVTL